MIIFHYENLEEFIENLSQNLSSEVFIQYLENKNALETTGNNIHQVILQYLGKPDPNNVHLNVLYQCSLEIKTQDDRDQILAQLKEAIQASGVFRLVRGKIAEVVHSY